ncbi:hypothetical protein EC991_011327 [Linnemannia zychae]|nr:hypothetical protein EC991_011327 [Linnemannia zychae]
MQTLIKMTDPPKDYLTSNASGGDGPNTTGRPRKRDSFFRFIGVKPKPSKQSMSPQLLSQQATALPSDSFHSKDNSSPPPLIEDLLRPDIFPENLPKPVIKTILPRLHARIEETAQLVYCNTSLLQDDALSAAVPREEGPDGAGSPALAC